MADVVFAGVTKRFGDVTVVEDFDLTVHDQEFLVLVGPSGCGKSTILRMLAGLEEVSSGTITIGGRVVNDLPPKDRDVAMVFQSYALYPHMTVRENLAFGLRMRRVPRPERERLVAETAEILGISPLLDRRPKQLSGGQRQRVALGRAIVRKPALFLFDEPLSNLDAKLRVQMRAEIVRLQRRLRATTVYVTHDQVEAMTMGRRIAVVKEGKLQQVGSPMEVYERPANLFVAQFIGNLPMNVLPARIGEGGAVLEGARFRLPVPPGLRSAVVAHGAQRVVVGIRPEHVHDARGEPPGESLEVEVEIAEPLGHQMVVHGRLGDEPLVATFDAGEIPEPGSRLPVTLDLEALHLFDSESGERVG